jgi:hypothetical protein
MVPLKIKKQIFALVGLSEVEALLNTFYNSF